MTKWWQERVIYQIYPRSFCDSNGDGIGDIKGIISKLDYLKDLGVGALWLSPVYSSPNFDFGYDVANYCDINPEYGTMEDMKQLLKEAASRDLKVVMDLVINHTSDQHSWFTAARQPDSPYRDYYIWRKARRSSLGREQSPNNWASFFTGPAWTKDELSGEYYLHLFSKQQPDLNYHNPKVIAEIKQIMKFWLDLGVAGFRCDVINLIYKQSLTNGKRMLLATGGEHYVSKPGCHRILQDFYTTVWQPYDAFVLGEIHNDHLASVKGFVKGQELSLALAFEHMVLKLGYRSGKVKQVLTEWQQQLSWNSVFFENHDGMRSVSRFGNDRQFHKQSATMLATLLLTLRGTPFIYEGQEIGMSNAPFKDMSQIKDVVSQSAYALMRRFLLPDRLAFRLIMYICRDHARTPMQWSAQAQAGFSTGKPWLMVNPNYVEINVEQQQTDDASIWHYYRKLLDLRSQISSWRQGKITFLTTGKGVLAYERVDDSGRYRVVVNMDGKQRKVDVSLAGTVVQSNYDRTNFDNASHLEPYEAVILKVA